MSKSYDVKESNAGNFQDKRSYKIELKRENKGVCIEEEVVNMATSGIDLNIKGLVQPAIEAVRLRVRVHTLGHHSKRHLDGTSLSQNETKQILNLISKVTESVVR